MSKDLDSIYCGIVRRGDVILAQAHSQKTAFLYVVLQDTALNETLSTVLAAPLVAAKQSRKRLTEYFLPKTRIGLSHNFVCELTKISFIDRREIVAKKGELKPLDLQNLLTGLDVVLGRFRD